MNLTISGHHLEVSPALREYVLTKMDRVTRHFDQVVDINVLLSVEKLNEKERRQKAEVTLHVKGKDIFVEHASEDLYAAIDQLMDKLDRQVCRHKDRVQDHHHVAPEAARRGDLRELNPPANQRPRAAFSCRESRRPVRRPRCCRPAAMRGFTTPLAGWTLHGRAATSIIHQPVMFCDGLAGLAARPSVR